MMPSEARFRQITDYGRRAGLYLVKEIRKLSSSVPIMVLTVLRDSSLREEAQACGAHPYLEKPIMPSRLLEEIEKKLRETRREDA